MDISVERTLDVGICLDILTNKTIFEAISEDTATIEDLKIHVINDYWVEIKTDITIGVAQFKQVFNKTWDCHIHILPEHRKEHSMKAGEKLLEWCHEYLEGNLLYTTVPEFCENVKKFLLHFGFKEVGILEKAWFKNGVQNNMTILTRIA